MLFYFTGTGNSLYVAQYIAEKQNQKLVSIANCVNEMSFSFMLQDDEIIGFSFPVYFWGMPTIVEEFIRKLSFENYQGQYLFVVFNCGGSIGNIDKIFAKKMKRKGYLLTAPFSVFMPDNYILMMDLLTPEDKIEPLLKNTDKHLLKINDLISKREKGELPLHKKGWPWLASTLAPPYYQRHRSTKPFHATEDCTSCGLCEKICPCKTISMKDGKPFWSKECTQCLACLHRCPTRAVQYGKKTYQRGRYLNPNISWKEIDK